MKSSQDRSILLLELGIGKIKSFNMAFKAYNTEFLGSSNTDCYIIDSISSREGKATREFCYGYDGVYHQLQLLDIYELPNGKIFASTEISNGFYAFWRVLKDN